MNKITIWMHCSMKALLVWLFIYSIVYPEPVINETKATPTAPRHKKHSLIDFKILAINDFHGQMSKKMKLDGRPVGGAEILVSYLKSTASGKEDRTIFVEVGDLIGASESSSALLQDEPAVMMFNSLGNNFSKSSDKFNPFNNIVGILGNHEFDEGLDELKRILDGGNYHNAHFLENPWTGAHFPVVCANAFNSETRLPIVPPVFIKQIAKTKIKIAFVGIIFKDAALSISATVANKLNFTDETEAINRNVKNLRDSLGIHAFVILIHQGQIQKPYDGFTNSLTTPDSGAISNLIKGLDDDVDVVCSAHFHSFSNSFIRNKNGKKILVTQAYQKGTAYADIDLKINPDTKDIVSKSARIKTTWADEGPGLTPDQSTVTMMDKISQTVAPIIKKVISKTDSVIDRTQNIAGESPLGNLIADAQRTIMSTDFSFMNPGGIRADIDSGDISWEDLFYVQPFNNLLVKMTMTGKQIYDLLNQQWKTGDTPRMLQVSGLTYVWDDSLPVDNKVIEVLKNGKPISKSEQYTVAVNNFLAEGGDGFTVFSQGKDTMNGAVDIDILVQYLSTLEEPVKAVVDGRIKRRN